MPSVLPRPVAGKISPQDCQIFLCHDKFDRLPTTGISKPNISLEGVGVPSPHLADLSVGITYRDGMTRCPYAKAMRRINGGVQPAEGNSRLQNLAKALPGNWLPSCIKIKETRLISTQYAILLQ